MGVWLGDETKPFVYCTWWRGGDAAVNVRYFDMQMRGELAQAHLSILQIYFAEREIHQWMCNLLQNKQAIWTWAKSKPNLTC